MMIQATAALLFIVSSIVFTYYLYDPEDGVVMACLGGAVMAVVFVGFCGVLGLSVRVLTEVLK